MHNVYLSIVFYVSLVLPHLTTAKSRLRLTAVDADTLKHVGVLTIYKILLINICCTFVGLDKKLSFLV
jgi:hypothetical protein